MKLLILTQKVDLSDDNLGFFHEWIEEFAKHYEKVTVICLFKGKYNLPDNVKVLSLGKEDAISKSKYSFNFFKYIWQERKNYDHVFVHMNQIYVLLGGLFWKLTNKKIGLWYVHGSVDWKLKIAEKIVNVVFTASPESFRVKSNKLKIVGHGIDVDKFKIEEPKKANQFKIISIGRITPSKDILTLIKAIDILSKDDDIRNLISVDIIGGVIYKSDEVYLEKLKAEVKERSLGNCIKFVGSIPGNERYNYFKSAHLLAHMSKTGSLDKVSLEAMASETLIVTCNDASREILKQFGNEFIYDIGDYKTLAKNIQKVTEMDIGERREVGRKLRNIVKNSHSLKKLINKIVF